jgi:hypothetical protein
LEVVCVTERAVTVYCGGVEFVNVKLERQVFRFQFVQERMGKGAKI